MRVEVKWSGVRSNRLMAKRDRKWKQKWRNNDNKSVKLDLK